MGITNKTTHIIVKTEKNLFAQRTLKYLQVYQISEKKENNFLL